MKRLAPGLLILLMACRGDVPQAEPVAAAAVAPQPAQQTAAASVNDVAATVDNVLSSADHPGLTWNTITDVVPALKPLYDAEPDRLLWFDGAKPERNIDAALTAVAAAGDYGLDPGDYDVPFLTERWAAVKAGTATGPELAHFDLALSIAAARMIRAVHVGRVDPATMDWGYNVHEKKIDVTAVAREVRQGKGLGAALDALEPPVSHYVRAKKTLAAYKALEKAGEPEQVPELPKGQTKLEPGKVWVGVPQLAARLRVFGDLPAGAAVTGTTYSKPLVAAVKAFQNRHVIDADGIIGAGTIRAINVTLAQRVRQIELAMERMRWLPELAKAPNVFVNVPLFRLWATDPTTGAEPLRMNVVVGKSLNHKTPIFVETMEYVVFRPYWNPPYGITVKEIIPHARRDASYMDREDLEIVASGADDAKSLPPTPENLAAVVSGKLYLRQRPGPQNSLGLAKFIFPNANNVYMHGTPAQQLFSRVRRDFSHGCIRLEDPARFAEWVLRDNPEWPRDKIDAAMQGERPTQVNLKQRLTVVLFYDTVHVNSDGVVFFADDIYAHDKALDAALVQGYPYAVKK
jgi:murein L,D-transpeptidase YcbB/YkuD